MHSALDMPPPGSMAASSEVDLPLPHSLPIWHRGVPPKLAPRQIDVPLSFDDLMVPIDQPDPIRQKFSATSENNRDHNDRQRVASLEMPPIDDLAPEARAELQRKLDFASAEKYERITPKSSSGAVHGSLASSAPWLASPPDRLPSPTTPAEDRHWIRQP